MEASGLERVFEKDYGKNTVTHMFSKKVIYRALCCYFLVETALHTLSIFRLKQHLVLMKRLLKRLLIKFFQMPNFEQLMLLTQPSFFIIVWSCGAFFDIFDTK